jgi:hypothetical protein
MNERLHAIRRERRAAQTPPLSPKQRAERKEREAEEKAAREREEAARRGGAA